MAEDKKPDNPLFSYRTQEEAQEKLLSFITTKLKEADNKVAAANEKSRRLIEANLNFAEEITALNEQIDKLKLQLLKYTKDQPLDNEWTAKDDKYSIKNPGWKYLKPYRHIVDYVDYIYPGLKTAIKEARRVEDEAILAQGVGEFIPLDKLIHDIKNECRLIEQRPEVERTDSTTQTMIVKTVDSAIQSTVELTSRALQTDDISLTIPMKPSTPESRNCSPPLRVSPEYQLPKSLNTKIPRRLSFYDEIPHPILKENFVRSKRFCAESRSPSPVPSTINSSYDYPHADEIPYCPCYHYPTLPTDNQIPSLLHIEVEAPKEVDPTLVEWLRRPPLHGCWNCGDHTHGHTECNQPKHMFCENCGEPGTAAKDCWNCKYFD